MNEKEVSTVTSSALSNLVILCSSTPQIIGIGLCGVFELIKETRFSHPSLCLRSLQALLDMLQGQQPESFQTEPPDVLGEILFPLRIKW